MPDDELTNWAIATGNTVYLGADGNAPLWYRNRIVRATISDAGASSVQYVGVEEFETSAGVAVYEYSEGQPFLGGGSFSLRSSDGSSVVYDASLHNIVAVAISPDIVSGGLNYQDAIAEVDLNNDGNPQPIYFGNSFTVDATRDNKGFLIPLANFSFASLKSDVYFRITATFASKPAVI